jgi:ankyrin repeat protein
MKSVWHLLQGNSPEESLHIATANRRLEEMRALIADGADVNAQRATIMSGQTLGTPLHLAATYGLVKPAEILIAAKANLDLLDGMELTALMCTCSCGGAKGSRIAMLLIKAGADVRVVRKSDEMTAIKFAAESCEPRVIQALIDAGADVDGPPGTDQTALMLAARGNNVPAIEILLRNGADPKHKCGLHWAEGKTAAWLARNEGRIEAYQLLKDL